MSDLTGQTLLHRYRVDSFLGRGGMADVYRVWDAERAVPLAMKVLREDLAQDHAFLRRFRREARVLETLQHPHIVRYYGLEQEDVLALMLMDFIEGTTLRTDIFRRKAPFPPERILRYFQPMCSALHYAHRQGVVHCDIKPGNILFDRSGRTYVTDFGIARLAESATVTFSTPGTPAYMSPEQCRGTEDLDARTDVYALGVLLYEMATGGERPFSGDTDKTTGSTGERIRWQHLNEPPLSPRRLNPSLSPELEAIILRCLAKKPPDWYQSAMALWEALERVAGKSTPGVQKPASVELPSGREPAPTRFTVPSPTSAATLPSPAAGIPNRPNALPWALGVVAVAVVVALVISLSWLNRSGPTAVAQTTVSPQQTETAQAIATLPSATHTVTPTRISMVPPPTEFVQVTPAVGANQTPIALFLGLPEFTETPQPFSVPFFPEEAYARGEKQFKAGEYVAAVVSFRTAIDQNKDNYAAYYYLGLIYLQWKNYNQAASAFNSALRINASFAPALLGRGQSNFGIGGNPLPDYQRARDAAPNWVEPYIQSAVFYTSRRNVTEAITQLETARQLAPNNVVVYWHLAEQYLTAGRIEDARATLETGFDIDATALDLYRVKTLLALVDENFETGLGAINIYISYRPADPEGWTLQGKVYLGSGKLSDALAALNRAIELKPVDPSEAYLARGRTNLLLGNATQAGDDFNRALAARFTTANLLLIGQAYYEVGDFENAIARFRRARDSDRTSFDTNYWLGAALVGNEQYGDALVALNQALSAANSDLRRFDAFYMRGKAYEGLDQREDAIRDMHDALVLNVAERDEARKDAELILSRLGGPKVSATYTPTPPGS